jgi:hypothetical protein
MLITIAQRIGTKKGIRVKRPPNKKNDVIPMKKYRYILSLSI